MKQSKNIIKIASFSLVVLGLAAPFSALALGINSISPTSGVQGKTIGITINGAGFAGDEVVSFYVLNTTTSIGIFNKTFNNSTQITGNLAINSTATLGPAYFSLLGSNGNISSASASPQILFQITAPGTFSYQTLPSGPQTKEDLLGILDTAVNWIFTGFIILAIVFIILAAFQFITGGGEAAKVEEARKKLIWATIGIIVALIAKGFPFVVRNILGA